MHLLYYIFVFNFSRMSPWLGPKNIFFHFPFTFFFIKISNAAYFVSYSPSRECRRGKRCAIIGIERYTCTCSMQRLGTWIRQLEWDSSYRALIGCQSCLAQGTGSYRTIEKAHLIQSLGKLSCASEALKLRGSVNFSLTRIFHVHTGT